MEKRRGRDENAKRNMRFFVRHAVLASVLIISPALQAAGKSSGVIDLGKAEISGKQALPQVNFILRTSLVEFHEQEPQLDDVLNSIHRDVMTLD